MSQGFPGIPGIRNPPANAGTQVWSPIWDDRICWGTAEPMCHSCWARTLEPVPCPQQEKPLQWKSHALQLENKPHSPQLEKAHVQQQRPGTAKSK